MGYFYCYVCGYGSYHEWLYHENICYNCVMYLIEARRQEIWEILKKIFRDRGEIEFKRVLSEHMENRFIDRFDKERKIHWRINKKFLESKISGATQDIDIAIANCLKPDLEKMEAEADTDEEWMDESYDSLEYFDYIPYIDLKDIKLKKYD